MNKTIGILGGMGPAATADLMQKIIQMTDAGSDQEHIPMLIDCNTRIPDRTAAILNGGEDPVPEMLAAAHRLEIAGADFIIMPCNTAHYFIPELEREISIPILNMPEETAHVLMAKGVKTAAVLATDGTCRSGLYEKALTSEGIGTIYPQEEEQEKIMSLIYEYIKHGVTDPDELPVKAISDIADNCRLRGAEALLLACTELPLAFSYMNLYKDDCYDPTRILAAAAIKEAGAVIR
jgi:aspartate racemase